MVAMKYASNIFHSSFLVGALQITFKLKIWVMFWFKYLDGVDVSCSTLYLLCLVFTFPIVSPTYDSQLHITS